MSNALMETKDNIPTPANEAENIIAAAREDSSFEKLLKFKKGKYFVGEETVALGTEFISYPASWLKVWAKFADNKVAERLLFRVAHGEEPPERDELDDRDQSTWGSGIDGKPQDPWLLQYLLPLENPVSGEIVVFATASLGGKRAIGDLCTIWGKRVKRGQHGLPVVQLQSGEMPTKKFGRVPCPVLKITGWTDTADSSFIEQPPPAVSEKDFGEEIPF